MQQRRPRLGDIVDDYCPRERRLTNHAVVAMVEDDVKQTRCATCDTEHEFKHGRMPTLRRKKDSVAAAYNEVLAAVTSDQAAVPHVVAVSHQDGQAADPPGAPANGGPRVSNTAGIAPEVPGLAGPLGDAPALAAGAPDEPAESDAPDGGHVHRRLIRATLPRTGNEQVVRPIPEFTMHQPQGRPGKFRGGMGRGVAARPGGGRGGHGTGVSRGPVFGRQAGNRAGAGRNDMPRHVRGHQPVRHGKKPSK
jgi:hypothetical protein